MAVRYKYGIFFWTYLYIQHYSLAGSLAIHTVEQGDHTTTRTDVHESRSPKKHAQFPGIFLFGESSITSDAKESKWRQTVEHSVVVEMAEGCGRMQNRLLTFEDGTLACARYRVNADLMQGEIYSYFLAKLIRIRNLPSLSVALPDIHDPRWQRVAKQLTTAQWRDDQLVILSQYVDNMNITYLPPELKNLSEGSVSSRHITHANANLIGQWSDMILFDYIIGNMDRLINSLHNKQWNKDIMEAPIHNLAVTQDSEMLVFLDNEDGLFHGYRILDRYSDLQELSLKAICVFRYDTAVAIIDLVESGTVEQKLIELISSTEPLVLQYLPPMPHKVTDVLKQRLAAVVNHIAECLKSHSVV